MIPLITFVFALIAFIIAVMNGTGKGKAPLWLAVALLSLGLMLSWLAAMLVR